MESQYPRYCASIAPGQTVTRMVWSHCVLDNIKDNMESPYPSYCASIVPGQTVTRMVWSHRMLGNKDSILSIYGVTVPNLWC
jgi:hypothetical protein